MNFDGPPKQSYIITLSECLCLASITTHNPTLFVQIKVEPLEQWNPGPSLKTYQPQRAKFAAWNSGTNTAVYNFSRFQLTIRQNRGIRCIGQLEIVESAAYKSWNPLRLAVNSAVFKNCRGMRRNV